MTNFVNIISVPLSQTLQQHIRSLHKRSEREQAREFVIEGEHLCQEALQHHAALQYVVVRKNFPDEQPASSSIRALLTECVRRNIPVYHIAPRKFELLNDTRTPQPLVGVVKFPVMDFIHASPILVLDAVSDPGNVGTLIRTADWFGWRNIMLGAGCADRFHPKTLRATMGAVFRCRIRPIENLAHALTTEFADYQMYGATLDATTDVRHLEIPPKTSSTQASWGIVLGSEAHGISDDVRRALAGTFRIHGGATGAESLNVAIAGGIVLYHCARHIVHNM